MGQFEIIFNTHFSEYYFLDYNLEKNFILQSKIDENGFLPLDLIASFPSIRNLTIDQTFIIDSLRDNEKMELSEDQQKVNLGKFLIIFGYPQPDLFWVNWEKIEK